MEEPVDYTTEVSEALELLHGPEVETGYVDTRIHFSQDGKRYAEPGGPYIKFHVSFRSRLLRELSNPALRVFICVGLHIDHGGDCFPSVATIAKETGYKDRAVIDALNELEGLGLISRTARPGHSNVYSILRMFAYGMGNDPIGEPKSTPAPQCTPAQPCTPPLHPGAPIRRTSKEEPLYPAGEKQPAATTGTTHASFAAGLSEANAKASWFNCEFCAEQKVINWRDQVCPFCGAQVIWDGNKWLEKLLKKDEPVKVPGIAKHRDPAIDFVQQLCGAKAKPEWVSTFTVYVQNNGLEAFKAMCTAIYEPDHEAGKYGAGILKHIAMAAPSYGKNGYQKSVDRQEPIAQPADAGKTKTIRADALALLENS
jgi:hypothetical protein